MVRNTYSGNGGYGHGTFTLRKPSALRSGERFRIALCALKLLGCAPLRMHLPLRIGIALKKQDQLLSHGWHSSKKAQRATTDAVVFVFQLVLCMYVVSVFQLFLFFNYFCV